MVKLKAAALGKFGIMTIVGLGALSMGACSTSSGVIAQGAPITYKVDQGQFQQAALVQPYSGLTHGPRTYAPKAAPRVARPLAAPVQRPQSIPSLPAIPKASEFDSTSVDTVLYKHQKVGKTYSIMGKSYTPKHQPRYNKVGTASWYGDKFHGRPTATGELFDMDDLTAAHKTLPLNSMVYVTNLETGQGMLVRVNDRGPFVDGRIIDLSRKTARRLGLFSSGLARVRVQYAGPADPMAAKMNKKPIARPSTPQITEPKIDETPNSEPVAQMPKLALPNYKPLRDLGQALAQQSALPLPQRPGPQLPFQQKQYVNPLLGLDEKTAAPAPTFVAPPQTALVPPKSDAPITLTIKGPIHMASSRSEGGINKPKFIPAVNYTKINSKRK